MDTSFSSYESLRDAYQNAKLTHSDVIQQCKDLIEQYVQVLDEFYSDDLAREILKLDEWRNVFGRQSPSAAGLCIRELLVEELKEWDFNEVSGLRKKRKRYYRITS